jgi:hypothetical protein
LQLDLKGHVYGLLAAHPVAPLVSLHHLDRLSPISPNSLKRLHAVRSLVGASRRDPARTLQQSICYYRPPSRSRGSGTVILSVSVSWGYMVHRRPVMFYLDRVTTEGVARVGWAEAEPDAVGVRAGAGEQRRLQRHRLRRGRQGADHPSARTQLLMHSHMSEP